MSDTTPVAPGKAGAVGKGKLEVLVRTELGTPVPGVVVEVFGQYPAAGAPLVRTDGNGRHLCAADLAVGAKGTVELRLWREGIGAVPPPGGTFSPAGVVMWPNTPMKAGATSTANVAVGGFARLVVDVRSMTGRPVPDADIEVVGVHGDLAGKKKPLARTDTVGRWTLELPVAVKQPDGAWRTTWEVRVAKAGFTPSGGPGVVTPVSGKVHELKVVGAVFAGVAEVEPAAGGRVYVNEPSSQAKRQGRYFTVRARLGEPNPGQTVHFRLLPAKTNRAKLPASHQATLLAAGATPDATKDAIVDALTATTDGSGAAAVVLRTSVYGGDTFRVLASLSPGAKAGDAGAVASGALEVWRRVELEVDTMKRPGGGDYSNRFDEAGLRKEYERAFVELTRVGTDDHPAHRRIIDRDGVQKWGVPFRQGTGDRRFHLILVDTVEMVGKDRPATKKEYAGGFENPLKVALDYELDPDGKWLIGAVRYMPDKTEVALPTTQVSIAPQGDGFVATIDLTGSGPLPTKAVPVGVRLTVQPLDSVSGLKVADGTTFVCLRWRETYYSGAPAKVAASALNTLIHEVGHTLGHTVKFLPEGGPNPLAYSKSGWHCHHPLKDETAESGYTCAMYDTNTGSTTFCPTCNDGARARVYSKLPVNGADSMTGEVG